VEIAEMVLERPMTVKEKANLFLRSGPKNF